MKKAKRAHDVRPFLSPRNCNSNSDPLAKGVSGLASLNKGGGAKRRRDSCVYAFLSRANWLKTSEQKIPHEILIPHLNIDPAKIAAEGLFRLGKGELRKVVGAG